jgi:hypothetical protein
VRLKRSVTARSGDADLAVDPYRTWAGISDNQLALRIVGIVLGMVFSIVLIVILAVAR